MPGDPSAKSAGVSAGNKQRWVSLAGDSVFVFERSERKSAVICLKCKHNHIKDDFSCLMFVFTPERKEKSKSTGVPHVTPTSPAASQTTVAQRSTK